MKTILVDAWNTFVKNKKIDLRLLKILEKFPCDKIIVTNANLSEQKDLGIINMPYSVFSLSHNPEKTNKLYFDRLCNEQKLKKEELLYIEHNIVSVETAKTFGIKSILFNENYLEIEEFLNQNYNE